MVGWAEQASNAHCDILGPTGTYSKTTYKMVPSEGCVNQYPGILRGNKCITNIILTTNVAVCKYVYSKK